jgi:hypothetical protein
MGTEREGACLNAKDTGKVLYKKMKLEGDSERIEIFLQKSKPRQNS